MASIFDWSSTAASNTAVDGININTGCSPANLDNADRSLMAIIRQSFASALQTFFAGSAPLPVANGGTSAADAATALTNLGGLSSAYRDLPSVNKSAGFTFADSERGGGLTFSGSSPATATLNAHATTAITVGAVYVIYVTGSANLTVSAAGGVSLAKNGATSSSSTAVIAPGGIATLVQWGTDVWTINGVGIS